VISQGKVTKEYYDIMDYRIYSIVQTSDKNYLFLGGNSGCLRQLYVKKEKVVRDYGKIHEDIYSIAITSDDK
jgi:hypothetical protein